MPSLLRYPGGKSRGPLNKQIVSHISETYDGGKFGELFFGGGGITLSLIKYGIIDNVTICEKDPALYRMWGRVMFRPHCLINAIEKVVPSVELFVEAKSRVLNGHGTAIDFIVVNRLSHGGRGVMAGPQGGYEQKGKYKIDCRWNPAALSKAVLQLNEILRSVDVELVHGSYDECGDFDYLYMDPPYLEVGRGLYQHSFEIEDHLTLRSYLSTQPAWLLSYNNHPNVWDMYGDYNIVQTGTHGNGGDKPNSELLIFP